MICSLLKVIPSQFHAEFSMIYLMLTFYTLVSSTKPKLSESDPTNSEKEKSYEEAEGIVEEPYWDHSDFMEKG